ncbi:MAG TPA: FHA domain-containing protein [Polyangiaceae bacterium]
MKHTLRYNEHDIDLPEGEFVIGRAANCQLSLDDPLVSRNHATLNVTAEAVVVADLGSRNGVRVNGDRIEGKRALIHGDQISIGSQDMTVMSRREFGADTLIQAPTQRVATFGLLGILADKALAMGKGEEAEKLLFEQLDQLLVDAQRGVNVPTETLERAADYALKLGMATGNGRWVDYIFRLHSALGRPCPAPVVDELYTVLRKVKAVNLTVLRDYLEGLRELSGSFGPADRFLLSRIEGLERLAAAK